jgi:hypothetical protein
MRQTGWRSRGRASHPVIGWRGSVRLFATDKESNAVAGLEQHASAMRRLGDCHSHVQLTKLRYMGRRNGGLPPSRPPSCRRR